VARTERRTGLLEGVLTERALPRLGLWYCPCQARAARTFSPLAAVLRERTTPELSYLQARFAGLVSYGLSADLLSEVLPLGRVLHATTVRRQVQATAQHLENELADEQSSFVTGCPAEWAELPVRTCRWSSAWTAATSTPAPNGPGETAGSR
jgi:hypothetical protein